MQIHPLTISANKLHMPPRMAVSAPPPPLSLDDIERDAMLLEKHERIRRWQCGAGGLVVGLMLGAGGATLAWWYSAKLTAPTINSSSAKQSSIKQMAIPASAVSAIAPVASAVIAATSDASAPQVVAPVFASAVVASAQAQQGSIQKASPTTRPAASAPLAAAPGAQQMQELRRIMPLPPLPAAATAPALPLQEKAKPERVAGSPAHADASNVVLYVAKPAGEITPAAPAPSAPVPPATSQPVGHAPATPGFRIVSIPMPGLAMVAQGENVTPVHAGGKLPDGSVLESADPTSGVARTNRTTFTLKGK